MTHSLGKSLSLCLLFTFFALFFSYTHTNAQTLGSISLTSSPTNPEPNENVRVSLQQYGVDTFGSELRWYVNDVEQTDFRNERFLEMLSGNLGETSTIRVSATQGSGAVLTTSLELTPTIVDLIIEADTYVPYFYLGRPLPSSESLIRVIAVPHGGQSLASNYTYKWTLGTTVLFGGPVKGKDVAEITMPRFGNKRLFVEVTDGKGVRIAKNSVALNAQDPELYFYEESPLSGLRGREIDSEITLFGEETTVSGEPYYMKNSVLSSVGNFDWRIDGRRVTYTGSAANKITLRKVGESGSAQINLDVIITDSLPQFVGGAFRLLFN